MAGYIKQPIFDLSSPNALMSINQNFDYLWLKVFGNIGSEDILKNSIKNEHIEDGAIDSAKIKEASIDTAQIKDAAIDSAKIALAAITTAHIQDASISSAKIQDLAVTRAKIANASIDTAKIADAAISSAKIQHGSIDTAHIKTGAITTALIADGAIETAQIADGSITDAKIVELTANKIVSGTIDTGQVTIQGLDGHLRITGNRLQVFDNQSPQIERVSIGDVNNDGSVYGIRVRGADGRTILYDENGVYNEGITDGAITNSKISDGAVDTRVIAANAVTADKIVAGAVTADKIAASAITTNKIASNAITGDKIAANSITSNHIQAGQIEAVHIKANSITSKHIASGSLVVGENVDPGNMVDREGVVTIINGIVTADYIKALGVTANRVITEYNGETLADLYKDSYGGVLELYDKYGNINVKIGVEAGYADNVGGTLVLYNDSWSNPRIELGISNDEDAGVINCRNTFGKVTCALYAGSNLGDGGALSLMDGSGGIRILLNANGGTSYYFDEVTFYDDITFNRDIYVNNDIYLDGYIELPEGSIGCAGSNSVELNFSTTYCTNLYAGGNISAASFTDRTPFYEGDALEEIKKIKGVNGELDHSTLPDFVRVKIKKYKKIENKSKGIDKMSLNSAESEETKVIVEEVEEEGRDIGAMVSVLTVGMQQLIDRLEKLEEKVNSYEKQ